MVLVCGLVMALDAAASAQMFGQRTVGRPLTRRQGPGAGNSRTMASQEQTGQFQFNERFVRGNRRATDFVGSDRRDSTGFVGGEQIGGVLVRSAATGLRINEDTGASINAPLQPAPTGQMYLPKLQVAFDFDARQTVQLPPDRIAKLNRFVSEALGANIEVLVEGQTTVLRGTVVSAEQKRLAESYLRFEPEVHDLRNELTVLNDTEAPADPVPQP